MVFVHGAAGYGLQWNYQLEYFAQRCPCLVVDMRGHGQSERPEWPDYSVEEFSADLGQVMDQVGIDRPVSLIGHSFGGAVSTYFTLSQPERVEKLALLSTTGTLSVGVSVLLLLKMPEMLLNPIQRIFQDRVGCPAHVLKKLVPNVHRWDGWELYPKIHVPTLVMCGELDRLTRTKWVRRMAESIPQVHYEGISFSAHLPQLERPARVNEALLTFVRGRSESPFR